MAEEGLQFERHFKGSAFVTDVVIGMSDGLTVPFALAAGISSAVGNMQNGNHLVVIAGLAEVAAGSIAMGLGGYLAGKTELDHYQAELQREEWEVDNLPDKEREEVRQIFAEMGMSEETQKTVVAEICKDKKNWVNFMMRNELGLEKPDPKRARNSALNIGLSYVVGGMVPLSPYFFTSTPEDGLKLSCAITVVCLFIFGFFKAKATGQNVWSGAVRVMLIGSVAAAAAFFIAKIFTH